MAVLKCKMCGGDLIINADETIGVCEFCGTSQTVPTSKDENLQGLFNRASALRQKGEFDKAELLYEKIISSQSTQAEAYWGLILCKYGIEYVEDPDTFKRVPTCHRASFDSVVADSDYKSALKYADCASRSVYEAEAKEIDRIQKDILAISKKEKPYDVFICYKETDENGRRTRDSVIANDIYHQLTQEGFKVFYASITLEDKLGKEYEPYIFAALNSAKVMLVIGTKSDYFNSVWVKNEWSRYLKLIKKDRTKLLYPCYCDMDPYELPDEFAHLQAQDMSKIGFINDVVRGIKKVITKDDPAPVAVVKETASVQTPSSNTEPLLKRMFMFLEDKNFRSADEYAEKVLDIDPENAQAYLGKLMVEFTISNINEFIFCFKPFESSLNYQKIRRFGDQKLLTQLDDILKSRTEEQHRRIYDELTDKLKKATYLTDYTDLSFGFHNISSYKDSAKLEADCLQKAKDIAYNNAKSLMASGKINSYKEAIKYLRYFPDHKDSSALISECETKIEELKKENIYCEALEKFNKTSIKEVEQAERLFETIIDYKDSKELISRCKLKVEDQIADGFYRQAITLYEKGTIAGYTKARDIFNKYPDWKLSKEFAEKCTQGIEKLQNEKAQREKRQEKKKKIKRIIIASVTVILIVATIIAPKITRKRAEERNNTRKYDIAMDYFEEGSYEAAEKRFIDLGNYKDSAQKAWESRYMLNCEKYEKAIEDANSGNRYSIEDAKDTFSMLGDFKDSKAYLQKFEDKVYKENHNSEDSGYYDEEFSYNYDSKGRLSSIERAMINNGRKEYTVIYSYTHTETDTGRVEDIKITYEAVSGIVFEHSDDTPVSKKNTYDANDRLIRESTTTHDGTTDVVFYRWYDEDNNLLTSDVTNDFIKGQLSSKGENICITKVVNDKEDPTYSYSEKVDTKGNLSGKKLSETKRELIYEDDNLITIKYDEKNRIEMRYDKSGNKTQQSEYKDGKLNITSTYDYQTVFIPDKE